MNKHTPGPWTLEWNTRTKGWDILAGDKWIASIVSDNDDDARLIAAAPELPEALVEAENNLAAWMELYPDMVDSGDEQVIENVRAAIAKATSP